MILRNNMLDRALDNRKRTQRARPSYAESNWKKSRFLVYSPAKWKRDRYLYFFREQMLTAVFELPIVDSSNNKDEPGWSMQ